MYAQRDCTTTGGIDMTRLCRTRGTILRLRWLAERTHSRSPVNHGEHTSGRVALGTTISTRRAKDGKSVPAQPLAKESVYVIPGTVLMINL